MGAVRRENGQALVMVVVVMMILQVIAWAFLARMNIEQRLAGGSTRSFAALYLAEAGLQRALVMLEQGAPADAAADGSSVPYRETLVSGAFTIETIERRADGLVAVVVSGEVAGASRRLQALVRLGPEALSYGIYARDVVSLEGQSRTYVVPHHVGWGQRRRGAAVAAGGEIRFDPQAELNVFRGRPLSLREGQVPDETLLSTSATDDSARGLVDLVLAGNARLRAGVTYIPPRLEDLRQYVEELGVRRVTTRAPVAMPSLDVDYYRKLAEANTANAAINAAAGAFGGYPDLRTKTHSRYSAEELLAIVDYFARTKLPDPVLHGVIFAYGPLELRGAARLTILDGALFVKGDLLIGEGVRLEVRHTPRARFLPGLVASAVEPAQSGTIQVERGATAIVDGLVLAGGNVDVLGGVLDVTGSMAGRNIVNNSSGATMIRFDPGAGAVAGLLRSDRVFAISIGWQELR